MDLIMQKTLPRAWATTATSYQEKQVGYQAYFIYAVDQSSLPGTAALYESWPIRLRSSWRSPWLWSACSSGW